MTLTSVQPAPNRDEISRAMQARRCCEIVFVCHGFPPEFHSGVFRNAAFAKYLPHYGVRPLVLTAGDRRAGPIIYGRFACNQSESQSIVRCDWFGAKPLFLRLLDRFAVLSSASRLLTRRAVGARVARAFLGEMGDAQPQLVYASSPPVEALYAGQALAARLKLPFVADLRDPWSYAFTNVYRSTFDHMLDRRQERRLLEKASFVVANSEGQKNILVKKVGIAPSQVRVITNGADGVSTGTAPPNLPHWQEGVFNIAHIGVTARAEATATGRQYRAVRCDETTRSLRFVGDALLEMFKRRCELSSAVRMNIIGEPYSEKFRYLDPLDTCITYHGPVSHAEALAAMSRADLLILIQIDYDVAGIQGNPLIPAKLFDYLQSGSEILAALQEGDAAKIVRAFPGTIVVPPRDAAAIRRHMEAHVDAWRSRGRSDKHVRNLRPYERKGLAGELAALLGTILENQGRMDRCPTSAPSGRAPPWGTRPGAR